MDCGVDDELFDLLIEYDENSSDGGDISEKENATESLQIRRQPTTKQYKMMQDVFGRITVVAFLCASVLVYRKLLASPKEPI